MLERVERRDFRTVDDVPVAVPRDMLVQECQYAALSEAGMARLMEMLRARG
jgi:hypothetical protein